MKSLARQYQDALFAAEQCKRGRSDRKRSRQAKVDRLMFQCLQHYIRKTNKKKRAA